jgi:hypothetical protein
MAAFRWSKSSVALARLWQCCADRPVAPHVLADKDPADVIAGIGGSYPVPKALPLKLHFFPFGGREKTLDWVKVDRE